MYKKIFYLHVGKTAGTSMNKYIASHFGSDESAVHIETDAKWWADNKSFYIPKKFLSGHVSFVRFLQHYPSADYYKFATFRKPIDHVISHLAWVRHLAEPGNEEFLHGHPVWVQAISHKLSQIDFADIGQLSHFVANLDEMECALFDNSQTRYLLAIPGSQLVNTEKRTEALLTLQQLDFVAITERYNESMAVLANDLGWDMPLRGERLNKSTTKYGLDGSRPDIQQALMPLIWSDIFVYKQAKLQCLKKIEALLTPAGVNGESAASHSPNGVRGVLDVATSKMLRGWVMLENNPGATIYLNVIVNDDQSFYTKANKLRPDLKDKGIHPTGLCGFCLEFPADANIKPKDNFVVRIMGQKNIIFQNTIATGG